MKIIGIIVLLVIVVLIGYILGRNHVYRRVEKELKVQEKRYAGIYALYEICSRWMLLKERGLKLSDFLKENKIKTVAVYGIGRIGKTIIEGLQAEGFEVSYGIDFHSDRVTYDLPVYNIKDDLPEVDMILVTVLAFDAVKKDLSEKSNAKILNIKDVLEVIVGE